MKKLDRKFKALCVMLNQEDSEVLRKLRCVHGLNISGTVKIFLKEKLAQLDSLKSLKNK